MHSPYFIVDRFPEPEAKDVPLDTFISVSFPRPPTILKLEIEPGVEISHVKKELILYSGKYTFFLAKPLQPGTNYTVTVTAGQKEPPGPDVAPTTTTSWWFTTTART
ncbi:MAG: Ig-like domain-containing protein [archaeon]|nr:Ig-like domain-containing protein [archaeon]